MFTNAKMFLMAAATAIFAPVAATAVTLDYDLSVGNFYTYGEVIAPFGVFEFRFTALEDLSIAAFALAATGTGTSDELAEDDVRNIRFGFSLPATSGFTTVDSMGDSAVANSFLPGGNYVAGQVFSIFFEDGILNDVSLGLSFRTSPPAEIPLPATALLLAPVLAGGIVAGMRKRKSGKSEA